MLQNPRKTLGFKKNMVYKIPPGGGGKPYPASGLNCKIYSFQRTITTKIGYPELLFLCYARFLLLVNICVKFREDSLNGF